MPKKKKVSDRPIGNKRGPKPSYPLHKWFDGKKHTLKFGTDFKANLKSMVNYLYKLSKARQLNIKIVSCLEIQTTPKKGSKRNAKD